MTLADEVICTQLKDLLNMVRQWNEDQGWEAEAGRVAHTHMTWLW